MTFWGERGFSGKTGSPGGEGSLQRMYSDGSSDPRRASGEVSNVRDQFTDIAPALPVYKVKQKAATLGAALYCILLAIYAVLIILSTFWHSSMYFLVPVTSSCNVLYLAVTGILQKHLIAEQQKEQRQGYLRFSKRLEWIVQLPFAVFAFGTAGVLLVVVWQPKEMEQFVSPLFLIRVLILIEIFLTVLLIAAYLRKVNRHHAMERNPDVMNSLYSALNPPTSLDGARVHDGGLAEQQATLLHYQQDNLRYLSEEILRLQEALSKYGSTPQVDVVHLLAAREQGLRAMTTERDQLLAEIRLAKNLIEERNIDILRVRSINDQYVEENQRIRAMLDEWSSRTAKLEMALEAERLSNADLHNRFAVLRRLSSEPIVEQE